MMKKIILLLLLNLSILYSETPLFEDDFGGFKFFKTDVTLKEDWRILKSDGGTSPKISKLGRLRLTEDEKWVSNAITLDYEFPTKNNIFVLEFKHYAYGGDNDEDDAKGSYGGDGISIILFDSSVGLNPQLGAFGGALGYAQMRNDTDSLSHKGFEKGWLGIGIDEYGNFTNHNEGKEDLDGTTTYLENYKLIEPNSVAIRGKQGIDRDHGYRKLVSTNLSKEIAKTSSWTSYSGDKFRLTVDSSAEDHLYITLERDEGSGYKSVISQFDAMDAKYNQGERPEYFRLAFAASTGGASNIHAIDEVKIYSKGWEYPSTHISVADLNITEGDDGKKEAKFTISLNKADPNGDISIDFHTEDGTAQHENNNSDYFSKSGTVIIPKGDTSVTVSVDVDGDFQDESDEEFYLILSNNSGGILDDNSATALILDDDTYDNLNNFTCSSEAYIYYSDTLSDPTDVDVIDLIEQTSTTAKKAIYPVNVNAIGYSVYDNFIWGFDVENYKVVKTDVNYKTTSYEIAGLENYKYHIGDVSPNGILYMTSAYHKSVDGVESDGIKRIYRVDVNPNSHKFLKVLPKIELSDQNLYGADWAFHPIDEKIYMVERFSGDLYQIDPDDGSVVNKGNTGFDYADSHVQFFDKDGYFYFFKDNDFYRIDITDPDNPKPKAEYFTHLPLPLNGDAARCAYAPMGVAYDISVSDSNMSEGDSGSSYLKFIITTGENAPAGGISIDYKTNDITAIDGVDYSGKSGTLVIPAGANSATIEIEIIGDSIDESDEQFELKLLSSNMGTIADDSGIGTISDDDDSIITLHAFDETSAIVRDGNITTKIVNKPFGLTISAYNESSSSIVADMNITKLEFINQLDGSLIKSWSGLVKTDANGLVNITNLNISKAFKEVGVKIYGDFNISGNSTDLFAIRPDSFKFTLASSSITAGSSFDLKVEARDFSSGVVSNYNEQINTSYKIEQSQTNSGCINATMDLTNANFNSGIISKITKYDEIGEVDIKISEINGSEFAKIDKDDGSSFQIPPFTLTLNFVPNNLDVSWTLTNSNIDYTFYSDDPAMMGSSLDIHIEAQGASGNIVKNYCDTCEAEDINISVIFNMDGNSGTNMDMLVVDLDSVTLPVKPLTLPLVTDNNFTHQTFKSEYIDGVRDVRLRVNFDRERNEVMEPVRLNIKDVKVNNSLLTDHSPALHSAIYYYARAHVPNQSVSGDTLDAKINYEIYCKNCLPIFTLKNNPESQDSIFWYIIPFGSNLGFNSCDKVYSGATVSKSDNETIHVVADKTPHMNIITYKPFNYLLYDPYSALVSKHKFKTGFSSISNEWAGKGDVGLTVDTNLSKKGYQKMDW